MQKHTRGWITNTKWASTRCKVTKYKVATQNTETQNNPTGNKANTYWKNLDFHDRNTQRVKLKNKEIQKDTKSIAGGSIQILYFNKNICVSFTAHSETAVHSVNWPFIVSQAENVTQSKQTQTPKNSRRSDSWGSSPLPASVAWSLLRSCSWTQPSKRPEPGYRPAYIVDWLPDSVQLSDHRLGHSSLSSSRRRPNHTTLPQHVSIIRKHYLKC